MYKIFRALIIIVWVLDVINVPQMEFLDTTLPINFLGWLLLLLFLPNSSMTVNHVIKSQKQNKGA